MTLDYRMLGNAMSEDDLRSLWKKHGLSDETFDKAWPRVKWGYASNRREDWKLIGPSELDKMEDIADLFATDEETSARADFFSDVVSEYTRLAAEKGLAVK